MKVELEYRDNSIATAFLLFWVNQDSSSDLQGQFADISKLKVCLKLKSYRLTPWRKNEAGRVTGICVWKKRHVKIKSTFWQFWCIIIPLHARKLMNFNWIFQRKWKVFDRDLEERNQVISFGAIPEQNQKIYTWLVHQKTTLKPKITSVVMENYQLERTQKWDD